MIKANKLVTYLLFAGLCNFRKYLLMLKRLNTLISFLSLIGWLMMFYINFSVDFAWESGNWIISPYLALVTIAVFQLIAYPALTIIDNLIQRQENPDFKPQFTFQKLMAVLVVFGMTGYITLVSNNYFKNKNKAENTELSVQQMLDFKTLYSKGCSLSGHQVKYNFYLKPIIVSDKKDTTSNYSKYVSDQVSVAEKRVLYKCATGEQVSTFNLFRTFLK